MRLKTGHLTPRLPAPTKPAYSAVWNAGVDGVGGQPHGGRYNDQLFQSQAAQYYVWSSFHTRCVPCFHYLGVLAVDKGCVLAVYKGCVLTVDKVCVLAVYKGRVLALRCGW